MSADRHAARADAISRCAARARALGYTAHEATLMAIGFADGWDRSLHDAGTRLWDAVAALLEGNSGAPSRGDG